MPQLKDIIAVIEQIAPPGFAAAWDNSGLQVGDLSMSVQSVLVSLDPLASVIEEAAELGCDLVVSHHPLFFRPIKKLDLSHGQGSAVKAAIRRGIAVYSAHTSLDRAPGGVSDALAAPLKLKGLRPLEDTTGLPDGFGFGRIGELAKETTVSELAAKLKDALGADTIKLVGDPAHSVKRVALCGGSGSELMESAHKAGADVFVTGDIKYHDALDALSLGMTVLDVGHFRSEMPVVGQLAGLLGPAFRGKGWDVLVMTSKAQDEPWSWL